MSQINGTMDSADDHQVKEEEEDEEEVVTVVKTASVPSSLADETTNFLPTHVVGMHLATHGLDGENLGADEAEAIYVGFVIFDTAKGRLVGYHDSWVRPRDETKFTWDLLAKRGLDVDAIKAAPHLSLVLDQLVGQLKQYADPATATDHWLLATDGQMTIRQALHPEAANQGMALGELFWRFCDLRKEWQRVTGDPIVQSIVALLSSNDGAAVDCASSSSCHQDLKNLGKAIVHLAAEAGKRGLSPFGQVEIVKTVLEHGICSRDDVVDNDTVVRARGLPWQSSDQDIARFFVGLNIARGGVALCLSPQGRRNGEALIRFETAEHRELALNRHRHFMGNRYIEVYRATGFDFLNVAAGNSNEAQKFLSRDSVVIIRMRGLPYDCDAKKIIEFFANGDNGISVVDGEQGILFVNKADGRATGDAFVLMASEEDAQKALTKHKEVIGTRYIELFRSTTAEVQQVINKSMETTKNIDVNGMPAIGMLGGLPNRGALPSLLPHQAFVTGSRKDCIRLRGLPYEAEVQHILEFLSDFSKHVVYQGVHMVFNAQGHPSGEAFIQMDSDVTAAAAAADRHNKYLQIGKKQRYIEVFQCSADDMNLVLTGPAPIHSPLLSAASVALAAAQARPTLSPAGNGVLPSPTLATALIPGPFGGYQFLAPQIWTNGNTAQLQNGAWTAVAATPNGALPYILNTTPRLPFIPGMTGLLPTIATTPGAFVYWPYPSPPVSPTNYFSAAAAGQQPAAVAASATVLVRGLSFNTTVTDVLNFFQGYPELTMESVQIQRLPNGQLTGDALISFQNRADAERAVVERNHQVLGSRPVDVYLLTM